MCKQGQQTATTNNPVSELLVAVSTKWLGAKLKFISQNPLRSMHQPARQSWKYFSVALLCCVVRICISYRCGASYWKKEMQFVFIAVGPPGAVYDLCIPHLLYWWWRILHPEIQMPLWMPPHSPELIPCEAVCVCVCDCGCNKRGKACKER